MNKITSNNINTIRIILALVVVIGHFDIIFYDRYFINDYISYYCVALFFLLSGYVNRWSIVNNGSGFISRRFNRLYKHYFIVVCFSIMVAVYYDVFKWVDLSNFLFLQHLMFPVIDTNGSLWSLSYEVLFYLMMALFYNKRFLIFTVLCVVLSCYFVIVEFYRFFELSGFFVVGILLNKYRVNLDCIKLKESKFGKYSYEVYIYHYPILFVLFELIS